MCITAVAATGALDSISTRSCRCSLTLLAIIAEQTAIHTKTTENKGDSHRSPVAIKSRKGQGAEFHLRDDDDVVGEGRPPVVRRAVPRRARACLPRTHTHTHSTLVVQYQIWGQKYRRRSGRTSTPDLVRANQRKRERERVKDGILTEMACGAGLAAAAGFRCRSRTRCLSTAFSIA